MALGPIQYEHHCKKMFCPDQDQWLLFALLPLLESFFTKEERKGSGVRIKIKSKADHKIYCSLSIFQVPTWRSPWTWLFSFSCKKHGKVESSRAEWVNQVNWSKYCARRAELGFYIKSIFKVNSSSKNAKVKLWGSGWWVGLVYGFRVGGVIYDKVMHRSTHMCRRIQSVDEVENM